MSWPGIAVRRTASLRDAYGPAIHAFVTAGRKAWMPGTRPGMTVEENLWLGAYLMDRKSAKQAADAIFDKYPRLAARRKNPAKVLSGGERRLLEICRALVMNPNVLLVDEPSIGLEPRFINTVFDILGDLQHNEGKTIVIVEQNAKKGLEFSDIGYVLVSGKLALAGKADELLTDPDVGRLFLGG
jgi:branched-chain amino acid transport system ATP-binding protein